MNIQFIVNPSAGQGRYKRVIHDIEQVMSEGQHHYDIAIPSYKGEATLLAKNFASDHDVVVAVGGDGTVNEVINGLVGTNAILGIIPAGTGNGFAREFGLPLHPREACKVLLNGYTRWIDIGKANDRYFVGVAGLGFDALIAKFVGEMFGPLRGLWIYFFAGMLVFNRYKPSPINIVIDSESLEARPLVVAIANTKRYGGRALIAPDAIPDDGLFDVCIIRSMGAFALIRHLPKLFKGTHTQLSYVKIYRSVKVTIKAQDPMPIHLDGEALDSCNKMQFTIIPKAIRLLIPNKEENGLKIKD